MFKHAVHFFKAY